jgi:hypothetical protein
MSALKDAKMLDQWITGQSVPEQNRVVSVGEGLRKIGLPANGLVALYGAGRFAAVGRMLRELAVVDAASAVKFYCRLPLYLNWVRPAAKELVRYEYENAAGPTADEDRRLTQSALSDMGITAASRALQQQTLHEVVWDDDSRLDLFGSGLIQDAWLLVSDDMDGRRDKVPTPGGHPLVLGSEAQAWALASAAITRAESLFNARENGQVDFDQVVDGLWFDLREWAELVDFETLRLHEWQIVDPIEARMGMRQAIRSSRGAVSPSDLGGA